MIEFRSFGSTSLKGPEGNELLSVLSRPKLLSFLVLLGAWPGEGYVRRETILGLLWSDLDPERARANLRQLLYRLRGSLGADSIETRGEDEIRLNPAVVWCDVRAFEESLSKGVGEETLALYRGDFMEGFFPARAPEFERWLDLKRGELRRLFAESSWALADQMMREGNQVGAGHWVRRSTEFCGCDEALFRRSIGLLEEMGDSGGALELFRVLEERLREECDLSPSDATRELIREILKRPAGSGEEGVGPPVPAVIGVPSTEQSTESVSQNAPKEEVAIPAGSPRGLWSRPGWPLVLPFLFLLGLPLVGGYYALGWPHQEGEGGEAIPDPIEILLPRNVLAVLPFESSGMEDESLGLAAGIQQSLFGHLSRIPGLTLISDRMTRDMGDRPSSLPDLALEIGAGTLLQGGLSWNGDLLRMDVHLVDGGRAVTLWEGSYQGTIREILDYQSEVALQVALNVGAVSSSEEFFPSTRQAPRGMEAYRPYLRSRAMSGTDATLADLMVEEQLLLQSLDQDPTFAGAWSALGWNYARRVEAHGQSSRLADSALVAAQTALIHDPSSSEAHLVMGWVFVQRGFLSRGEESFSRALDENGNLAQAFFFRGRARVALGRFDEAIQDFERALVRDPGGSWIRAYIAVAHSYLDDLGSADWWMEREIEGLVPDSLDRSHLEAVKLAWRGDFEGAFQAGLRMVEAGPEFPRLRLYLGQLALRAGRCEESLEHLGRAMAMSGTPEDLRSTFFATTLVGLAHQECGQDGLASPAFQASKDRLLGLVEEGSEDPLTFLELAAVFESLGDRETAVVWIQKAYQEGLRHLRFLEELPNFEALRSDPGYQEVREAIRQELRRMRLGLREAGPLLQEEALLLPSTLLHLG